MKLLSYDIEIYNNFPENEEVDLHKIIPSVAAIGTNESDVQFFYDDPYMSIETSKKLVNTMIDYYKRGFIPWGWNICGFDLKLLGYYSGMVEECAELALNGIDGMLLITFNKGYFCSLMDLRHFSRVRDEFKVGIITETLKVFFCIHSDYILSDDCLTNLVVLISKQ